MGYHARYPEHASKCLKKFKKFFILPKHTCTCAHTCIDTLIGMTSRSFPYWGLSQLTWNEKHKHLLRSLHDDCSIISAQWVKHKQRT